jgi:hypothetical protein
VGNCGAGYMVFLQRRGEKIKKTIFTNEKEHAIIGIMNILFVITYCKGEKI